MTDYWAVMLDECGEEFGAGVTAKDYNDAMEKLRDMYPESRGILQIETPQDALERESWMRERLRFELDGDMGYDDFEDDSDGNYY